MLSTIRLHQFTATPSAPITPPAFTGPVVRATIGLALRARTCIHGCGDAPCRIGTGCPWTDEFEPAEGLAAFHLDSSDLDGRSLAPGDPWRLVLSTFRPRHDALLQAVEDAFIRGFGHGRVPHRLVKRESLSDGGGTVRDAPGPPDLDRRAAALTGDVLVTLPTPAEIKRGNKWVERPTFDDLLYAINLRAERMSLPVPKAGDFRVRALGGDVVHTHRWSAGRREEIPIRGARRAWEVHADADTAAILAVGEVLGVGKGVVFGKGVVRCHPLK